MPLKTPFNPEMQQIVDEHREWLQPFDPQYLANWNKMLRHDDEAAMTEAVVSRILQINGCAVEPNERLSGDCGGPDFRCTRNGSRFYVEVTCISIEAADNHENATDLGDGVRAVNPYAMTEAVFRESQSKTKQCSNLDAPCLVAIGTWNGFAAMSGFHKVHLNSVLTGKTSLSWNVSIATGQQVGDHHLTTELRAAAFLKPDNLGEIKSARNSISGLLLCNCGSLRVIGVLHPSPARPFSPDVLPGVEFGSVETNHASGQLSVTWQGGAE